MRHTAFKIVIASLLLLAPVLGAWMVWGAGPAAPQESHSEKSLETNGPTLALPLVPNSVRFAVIGDSGTGKPEQYQVAAQMNSYHERFPFEFVLMLGDNLYGGNSSVDFEVKFERPYQRLLETGVKFYAALGNHDNTGERFYKPFNMEGQRYYTFKKGDARFFALDSNYMDPEQVQWLQRELEKDNSTWKICFFHHPLYSDGKFHGPDTDLRALLEPMFEKSGVAAVLSGHEHVYERLQPQHGIQYFVLGSSGELRLHNLRPSSSIAKGFDTDQAFMIVEVAGDRLYFQTISRMGQTVDSGVLNSPATSNSLLIKQLARHEIVGR